MSRNYFVPCSAGILFACVIAGFATGPVELVAGWLFVRRHPVWFKLEAYKCSILKHTFQLPRAFNKLSDLIKKKYSLISRTFHELLPLWFYFQKNILQYQEPFTNYYLFDFIFKKYSLRACDTLPYEQFSLHSYFSTIFNFSKK